MTSHAAGTSAAPSGNCCICLDTLESSGCQTLQCGHTLHELCVLQLRRYGGTGKCPICRKAHEDLTPLQDLLDRSALCMMRKSYEECRSLAREALDIDPENPFANGVLGQLYMTGCGVSKDLELAKEFLETANDKGCLFSAVNLGVLADWAGDFKEAQRYFKKGHDMGFADATFNLAGTHRSLGNLREAEELYAKLRVNGDPGATYNLGMLFSGQGRREEARKCFSEAWHAGDVAAGRELGKELYHQGLVDEAVATWRLAVRRASVVALTDLAETSYNQGRYDDAEQWFLEAFQQGTREAANGLGRVYEKKADLKNAEKYYKEARRLGAHNGRSNLASLYFKRGDLARARTLFEEEVSCGNRASGLHNLGSILQRQGEPVAARDSFMKAWKEGCLESSFALGNSFSREGDTKQAKHWYCEGHAKGHLDCGLNLGQVYEDEGLISKARDVWTQVHENGHLPATFRLATLEDEQKNVQKALKLYEEAGNCGCVESMYNLGILLTEQDKFEQAEAMYKKAYSKGHMGACMCLGVMAFKKGDIKLADDLLVEAHNGGNTEAASKLAVIRTLQGRFEDAKLLKEQSLVYKSTVSGGERWNTEPGPLASPKEPPLAESSPKSRDNHLCDSKAMFKVGEKVVVHGLVSAAGKHFNGQIGTVVNPCTKAGRVGIQFENQNLVKAILPQNLSIDTDKQVTEPLLLDSEDLAVQNALLEGAKETVKHPDILPRECDDHAAVSARLLHINDTKMTSSVALLKFSRCPRSLKRIVLESPELANLQSSLHAHDFPVELEGGATILVDAKHYLAVVDAVRANNVRLYPEHIIVDLHLENIVTSLVDQLPKREKVYLRKPRVVIPIGFFHQLLSMCSRRRSTSEEQQAVIVQRTFIDINFDRPASKGTHKTQSTTDADARKGGNPRFRI